MRWFIIIHLLNITANSSTHSISFIFNSGNTLNEQFGFNTGSTVTFVPGSGTSTLVSTNVTQFVPENTVYIHSNLVNGEYNDILETCFNDNNPPFSYITYQNPDPLSTSKALNSGKAQQAVFSFTDEHNIPLYFNGANVTLTIMIYKDNDFYNRVEGFIKLLLAKEQASIE